MMLQSAEISFTDAFGRVGPPIRSKYDDSHIFNGIVNCGLYFHDMI